MNYSNCNLCPRACQVNRAAGERGFCGGGDTALVAKTMLHKWEEPALAGEGGSGAIFLGAVPWAAAIVRIGQSPVLPWVCPWILPPCVKKWKP